MTQLIAFYFDVKRMVGTQKMRILIIWLTRTFWGCMLYRFEHGIYLLLGDFYRFLRIPFLPLIYLIQAYSNMDIHYKAHIGKGVLLLHPAVGCVISGRCIIGNNLTLTGGNIIGTKYSCRKGEFVIGNHCNLGGNATIVGPLILGNYITIGASACVISSFRQDHLKLVGVPARVLEKDNPLALQSFPKEFPIK